MASGKSKKSVWVKPSFDDEMMDLGPPKKKSRPEEENVSNDIKESPSPSVSKSCTWLDTFKPSEVCDLAPTKSKITELENWLTGIKSGQSTSKYLLITGPSGCGKTSSVHIIGKQMGFKVIEWVTPIDKVKWKENEEQVESQTKVFSDFLTRGSRYGSVMSGQQNSRLILVKDFPNVFINTPTVFHEILTDHCDKILSPVVFICDGKKAYKLFPTDLVSSQKITQINFSSVCFRTVKQILLKILKANKIPAPRDDHLKEIYQTSGQDLRSCILQTYYMFSSKRSNVKLTSWKKTENPEANDRAELFQTTGRVLYPKTQTVESKYGYNILKFTHDPDQIVGFYEKNRSDLRFLHHNYTNTFSNITDISNAAEYLSFADVLWNSYSDNRLTNQNLALSIAVRGLMCTNKKHCKGFRQFGAATSCEPLSLKSEFLIQGKNAFSSVQGTKDLILDYVPFLKNHLNHALSWEQKSFFQSYFSNFKNQF